MIDRPKRGILNRSKMIDRPKRGILYRSKMIDRPKRGIVKWKAITQRLKPRYGFERR